jgi:ribose 1,5-bisphosphokinase PhnN
MRINHERPLGGQLWLVNGLCGAGRSTALKILGDGCPKLTTRSPRKSDEDIVACSVSEFAQRREAGDFLTYQFGGYEYGIALRAIDERLAAHGNVSLVVSDPETMRQLRALYPYVRVVSVFITSSEEIIRQRLTQAGVSQWALEERVRRSASILASFNAADYDAIIANEGTTEDLSNALQQLLMQFGRQVFGSQPP